MARNTDIINDGVADRMGVACVMPSMEANDSDDVTIRQKIGTKSSRHDPTISASVAMAIGST